MSLFKRENGRQQVIRVLAGPEDLAELYAQAEAWEHGEAVLVSQKLRNLGADHLEVVLDYDVWVDL